MSLRVEIEDAADPTHRLFGLSARWSWSLARGNRDFLAIAGFSCQSASRNLCIPLMNPYRLISGEYRLSVKGHEAAFTQNEAQRSCPTIEKAMEKFGIAFNTSDEPRLSALGENHFVRALMRFHRAY